MFNNYSLKKNMRSKNISEFQIVILIKKNIYKILLIKFQSKLNLKKKKKSI